MERRNDVIAEIAFISTQLKEWRKEKGVTQQNIADFLNMEQPNYNRLEKGNSYLDVNTAFKICHYYQKRSVELNYLHALGENTPEIALINSILLASINRANSSEIGSLQKTAEILQEQIDCSSKLYDDLLLYFAKPKGKRKFNN